MTGVACSLLLLGLALTSSVSREAVQAERDEQAEESPVEKYVRLAREGKPVVRPQAARRLIEMKAEAAALLVPLCGQNGEGVAALGKDLVAIFGALENSKLRAHLWTSLADGDFPWRPSAASSLASTAVPEEALRYRMLLDDPIGRVRTAAIDALRNVDHREAEPALRAALADQDDRVRRSAAALLADWGDPCALYWLIEDLSREDRFFSLHTGKLARYEAAELLEARLESTHEYSARKAPTEPSNIAAIAGMREELAQKCATVPQLPAVARAGTLSDGDALGLELRSCRRGEFFLRWNVSDVLLVGTGNPARIELPKGTVTRLLASAAEQLSELKGQFWGEPGCDIEQFHYQPDAAKRPRAYRVNKGQAAVEGLRPAELGVLAQHLCKTLPDAPSDDPRIDRLASRVREALAQLGGEIPAAPIAPR